MPKFDWKDGLIVVAIVMMATGFVLPLHLLKSYAPHSIGGDTTTYIEAQPLNIKESLYIDGVFGWMRNSTYSQFYDANSNVLTNPLFSSLGFLWCILIILSIFFSIVAIAYGKFKGYYVSILGLATLCSFLTILIFFISYGYMLSSIAGHASFSGTGYDATSGVTWTSTPQLGFYLPLIGAFVLLIMFLIAWKRK